MPIYEYRATHFKRSCSICRVGFEQLQSLSDEALEICPHCGGPVQRVISPAAVGASKTMLDDRAKNAGFTKLKRIGKGEYEKEY
jgi:putative FmdB family regulatory protein